MKIFVGFGYHEKDQWVRELVFPLIESFDGEVESGEEIFGAVLAEGVKGQINTSDVVFAIFTPRDEKVNGKFTTSDWVSTEYHHGLEQDKKTIAFIESKVEWNPGIGGNRQYVPFDENEKDKLVVKMSKILCGLKKRYGTKTLRLHIPDDFVDEIRPLINKGLAKCTYRYMADNTELEEIPTKPIRMEGGIYIVITNLPVNGLLQVKVSTDLVTYTSDYKSLEFLSTINLSKE